MERDATGADYGSIVGTGFAPAQLDALIRYYDWLKQKHATSPELLPPGSTLNVTGYSLGGHLTTVFTEMHKGDPEVHIRSDARTRFARTAALHAFEGLMVSSVGHRAKAAPVAAPVLAPAGVPILPHKSRPAICSP